MLYPINNREYSLNLYELVSLQNQVKAERLQDKLGNQNFHKYMKKIVEPVTESLESTSQDITKTKTETSIKNNQAIENLNNKLLEIMNDRGKITSYLLFPLSKITNLENTSQFKLIKNSTSNRVNDLKINKTIPFILHDNLLTFRDRNQQFELKIELLKKITNKNYNVDLANLSDKKLMYDFAKEMNFDVRGPGRKSIRDKTLMKLLKWPGLMVSASGVSKTRFLSTDADELCDRLKLLLQEKQAGDISDIIKEEIAAIADKLLEYKCISKEQHKQNLIKCNLLHE